jgi:predicted transcriptional regulator
MDWIADADGIEALVDTHKRTVHKIVERYASKVESMKSMDAIIKVRSFVHRLGRNELFH